MRGLEQIGVLGLVTARADLDLRRRTLHRIALRMQRVAAGTRQIAAGVRAGGPIVCRIRLVAAQTIRVLLRDRTGRFGAEDDETCRWSASRADMSTPGPVAGLALQTTVAEWAARIVRTRVLGSKDARDGGIVVATKTGIGALRAVRWFGRRGGRRGRIGGWCCAGTGRERRHGHAREHGECGGQAGASSSVHSSP